MEENSRVKPAKPVIMTVDDEPHVLNAVARDLQAHYRSDYRIVKAGSGSEALETALELKRRNTPVALFLVDQRMPEMSGVEFLEEAIRVHPEAKKVLLTAYADTDAAIASINAVGLDYYLMKPWDPPEERLYPVLDDLMDDWRATAPVPYDGIRVAGALWCASSHGVKDFLARSQIRTSGWTSKGTPRPGSWSSRRPESGLACRCSSSPTGPPWSARTSAPWPTRWGWPPRPSSRFMI